MNELALVGWEQNPWELEADTFFSQEDFLKRSIAKNSYYLIIINQNSSKQESQQHQLRQNFNFQHDQKRDTLQAIQNSSARSESFLEQVSFRFPSSSIILVQGEEVSPLETLHWVHRYAVVSVVHYHELNRVQDLVNVLLLTKRLEEQTETHQTLLKEESEQQEILYQQLLQELSAQQKKINEIQTRLVHNLQQEKILHDTLLIIMTSEGLVDIELRLQEALTPITGSVHLRILLHSGSVHPLAWSAPAIGFELYEEEKMIGQMIITPLAHQIFTKRDLKLLENISEAVALHIPRLMALQANMELELEWRATFDAISDPLMIVSDSYLVIDANKAAKSRMPRGELRTAPCFELMFGRSSPCDFCHFGMKNNIESRPFTVGEVWEMSSHELNRRDGLWKDSKQKLFIHLYRNKYEQKELEEKLKDSSKAAEVGIFKASLAHELNNPLGGLLTLAQLQKMDLKTDQPLYLVIQEIEKQAFMCRDLIQDLLQKTRK